MATVEQTVIVHVSDLPWQLRVKRLCAVLYFLFRDFRIAQEIWRQKVWVMHCRFVPTSFSQRETS